MVFASLRRLATVSNFRPLYDRVLVQKLTAETQTKGGIMIPEKAQAKVLEATVVAAGPGAKTEDGKTVPMSVKVGDRVLLPEWGEKKVVIQDEEYYIFREQELLGVFDN